MVPELHPRAEGVWHLTFDPRWYDVTVTLDGVTITRRPAVSLLSITIEHDDERAVVRAALQLIATRMRISPDVREAGGQDLEATMSLWGPASLLSEAISYGERVFRALKE